MRNGRGNGNNGLRSGGYVGWSQSDREELGILRTRMVGFEKDLQDLGASIQQQFSGISATITALSTKLDERAKIPWPALGVMLTFLTIIGGLVWWPVREGQARTEAALLEQSRILADIAKEKVSVREADARGGRTQSDIARLREDVQSVERVVVPRGEMEEKWRSTDRDNTALQRQIDDLKKFNTDLVSARDFLKNLDDRMRALEMRRPAS